MKLQIIYSTENGQEFADFDFKPEIIETKESFIDFCLRALQIKYSFYNSASSFMADEELKKVPVVVKLSACIILKDGEVYDNEPEWFKFENGKVYLG